jgi:hypothetical protein
MSGRPTPDGSSFTRREVIDNVPLQDVDRILSDFKDSGALEVVSEPMSDGTWRVTAIFPS